MKTIVVRKQNDKTGGYVNISFLPEIQTGFGRRRNRIKTQLYLEATLATLIQ